MTFRSCQNLMSSELKSNGLSLCKYWREGCKLHSELTSLLSRAPKRTFVESVIIKFKPERCNGKVLNAIPSPVSLWPPGLWYCLLVGSPLEWSSSRASFCHVTVHVSYSLLFTGNYKNLHTKSSDITFTHQINIYLLNICCLADTIPGLSHRTVGAESGCASNGTDSRGRQTLHACCPGLPSNPFCHANSRLSLELAASPERLDGHQKVIWIVVEILLFLLHEVCLKIVCLESGAPFAVVTLCLLSDYWNNCHVCRCTIGFVQWL